MNNASTITIRNKRLIALAAIAGFAALLVSPAMAKSNATPASSDMTQANDSDLRLSLDKVDLDIQSGKYDEANDLIQRLKAKYPDNAEVLAAEAEVNGEHMDERGDMVKVVSDLCAPNSLAPNSMDLLQRENLGAGAKNFVCADYNRRVTNQSLEQISSLTGQVAVPFPGVKIAFDLENDHANSRTPFTYSNNSSFERGFYGSRHQGSVMVQKTFDGHNQAGVTVYGNDDQAGVGAQYVYRDRWGGTSIQGSYRQPDWDYIEMIAQNGVKDNLRIERKQVFMPNLIAVLSAGYTHYSLENLEGAADAPGWNFGLDYTHPLRLFELGDNDPSWYNEPFTLGAHYGVDAEYFTFVDHRLDASEQYHPLPATSYEVHSFTGSIGKTILMNVDAEIEGGYGVNRWDGSSGPLYGGSLTYTPFQNLGIDVHASRTLLGGQNNGGKEDIAGASVKFLW